jgi:transposase
MHPKPLVRRTHSPEFKARVLAACRQPGTSIAAVALAHGINANVVHKWLAGIGLKRAGLHLQAALQSTPSPVTPMQFLPVGLGASGPERGVSSGTQDIHLDLDLGTLQIKLNCPRGSAPSAAALLHALADMVARA